MEPGNSEKSVSGVTPSGLEKLLEEALARITQLEKEINYLAVGEVRKPHPDILRRHIIKAQQFNVDSIQDLFVKASWMEDFEVKKKMGGLSSEEIKEQIRQWGVRGKTMISLFYESSTRTRGCFEIAMDCLGGNVIFSTENAGTFSSEIEGETLEDTIKILDLCFPDVIVLRHYEEGAARRAAEVSVLTPIINAGDGPGEHPTQALTDLFTLWKSRKNRRDNFPSSTDNFVCRALDGLQIAMVGDLASGRTVRSFSCLLGKYKDIVIYFVSPEILRMGDDIKDYLGRHKVKVFEVDDLALLPSDINAIYQTRIPIERMEEGGREVNREEIKKRFSIDAEVLERFSDKTIVMHPLPRSAELSFDVDNDAYGRNWYVRQAQNGLFIRMALLQTILVDDEVSFDPFRTNEVED